MQAIKRMYLVDDDDIFQFLTQKAIAQTELVSEVQVFSNGLDAWTFLNEELTQPEHLPDLILLDLAMPVMDGWEFLHRFSGLQEKLEKKIPVFVVSSSIDPIDMHRAKAIPLVTEYVVKPVTKAKFMELIEKL